MFGERLRILRYYSGMTQNEVAQKIGINARTLGYYEKEDRRPSPEMLIKLANFYNVTTDYILGRSNNLYDNFVITNLRTAKKNMIVKILSNIKSGRPLFADEHIKDEILISEQILNPKYNHFLLKVTKDNMIGDNIYENDIVLIRIQDHIDYSGQITAVIFDNYECCLKRIFFSDDQNYAILRSSSPKYSDIVRPINQIHINGVFAGYFKSPK